MMTISPETFRILETAPLFQNVQRKLLFQQLNNSRLRSLNSGEALLVPGQTNNVIYIILSGRISIKTDYSDVEPLAMLGEGECMGETCIIGDVYVPTYFIAATDCRLLEIDHAAMWRLIDSSHQAAHNVLSALSMRIHPVTYVTELGNEDHNGFSETPIIDEITGLYNREWIERKILRYLGRYVFDKKPGCLMLVEIDNFHELCDKYGQFGCELVLRHATQTMVSCLRPDDHAGQFLAEIFAVFMPNTTISNGCLAAERLKRMIEESVVVLPCGDALPPISVSMGICPVNSEDTVSSLFARTREALQHARESGGRCVRCCGSDSAIENSAIHK